MSQFKQNYNSAVKRLRNAKSIDELDKINLSIDRVYNAGLLTKAQLRKLDAKYIDACWQLEMEAQLVEELISPH